MINYYGEQLLGDVTRSWLNYKAQCEKAEALSNCYVTTLGSGGAHDWLLPPEAVRERRGVTSRWHWREARDINCRCSASTSANEDSLLFNLFSKLCPLQWWLLRLKSSAGLSTQRSSVYCSRHRLSKRRSTPKRGLLQIPCTRFREETVPVRRQAFHLCQNFLMPPLESHIRTKQMMGLKRATLGLRDTGASQPMRVSVGGCTAWIKLLTSSGVSSRRWRTRKNCPSMTRSKWPRFTSLSCRSCWPEWCIKTAGTQPTKRPEEVCFTLSALRTLSTRRAPWPWSRERHLHLWDTLLSLGHKLRGAWAPRTAVMESPLSWATQTRTSPGDPNKPKGTGSRRPWSLLCGLWTS